jgi:XTP/dITP diphosphohydrolase
MSLEKIVLATGNSGKVAELADKLSSLNIEVMSQSEFNVPEVAETGTTFIENAIIKARHAAKITGLPAIADDSGLEVTALGGAPGIYSARFAGDNATDSDNIDKLLAELGESDNRTARFWCALVLMRHADDPTPIICQGVWQGEILDQRQGEQGFGYDPVFYSPEKKCSAAMLDKATKHALSHRGKALSLLLEQLKAI